MVKWKRDFGYQVQELPEDLQVSGLMLAREHLKR